MDLSQLRTQLNSGVQDCSLPTLKSLKVSHCPLSGPEVRAMLPSHLDLPGEHRTAEEQVAWQVSFKVRVTITITAIEGLRVYHYHYRQAVTLLATLGLAALSGTMAGMAVKYLDQC